MKRQATRCALAALVTASLVAAPVAAQTPFRSSRVGGLGLIGPATSHPASPYYNPATLALLTGYHAYAEGQLVLGNTELSAAPVDPASGQPTGGSGPAVRSLSPFPELYVAAQSDLGIESVVLGLAVSTPATVVFDRLQGPLTADGLFDPALQDAGRYHGTDLTLYHVFITPGAAVKIADSVALGFSFSFVLGSIDFGFVDDTALRGGRTRDPGEHVALDDCAGMPCGYGADSAAEAIRVTGTASGIAVGAGILVRPHANVDLGLGFQSGVVVGLGSRTAEGEAHVRRAEAAVLNAQASPSADPPSRDVHGRATIAYTLPHSFALGAVWRAGPRWTFETQLHWTLHSMQQQLDIRLTGPQFRDAPSVPDHIVLYQGLQDTVAVQLGAARQLTSRIALQAAAMVESPALPAEALTPRTIDGWKLDALLAVRWKISRLFTVQLGYGLLWVPPRDASPSSFAPENMVECVESHFDVARAACQAAEQGRGTASAAGSYSLALHRVSASLAVDVW